MLEVSELHVKYGGIHALRGISLNVEEKRIVSLLGANGAGKSTTVRSISGMVQVHSGTIGFQGVDITKSSVHEIQRMGLVHIPEGRKIFANLSVRENLMMGAYNNRDKHDVSRGVNRVSAIFPILEARFGQLGGTLSGGEQQMLAIGRALMSKPTMLMMDEPSLGLAPLFVQEVFRTILRIRDEGVTIFLIEQNANAALGIADYAYLLENGHIVTQGSGAELLSDESLRQAYLGEKARDESTS